MKGRAPALISLVGDGKPPATPATPVVATPASAPEFKGTADDDADAVDSTLVTNSGADGVSRRSPGPSSWPIVEAGDGEKEVAVLDIGFFAWDSMRRS